MKNKKAILLGIGFSIFSIFFIAETLQFFLLKIWTSANTEFYFFGWDIIHPEVLTKIQSVVILSFPVFYIISTIQLTANLLKYQGLGTPRFTLLIFIIINFGYLLVNIFVGAFNIILDKSGNNDWAILTNNLELDLTWSLFLIFVGLLLIGNYMKTFTKIITNYTSFK